MRLAGLALLPLLCAPAALAAGRIEGSVKLAGPPPKRPPRPVAKDTSVCGKEAADEALLVAPDGGLANVVVSLRNVKSTATPPPAPNATIDQVGCRYVPHVQAVTLGTKLQVLNNDAVFHNVHATHVEGGKSTGTLFNVAMPFKGMKLPRTMGRPGVFKLRCDAGHTWMSAWVHVLPHAHFAVSDARGAFTLPDVPAGEYELELWHEPQGEAEPPTVQRQAVRVSDGLTTRADVRLTLPPKR